MRTIKPKSYVKMIAIKIDVFESKIVDERHFAPDDLQAIARFKAAYSDDKYTVISVIM